MRTLYLLVLGALLFASAPQAQPRGIPAWYQVTSRSGTEVVQARILETHTSRSGETRVDADGRGIRTDGPVLIIPLGTSDSKPQPQSTGGYTGGVTSAVTFRSSPKFIMYSFGVKVEGQSVVRMTDMTTHNQTTTSSETNSDGSTSTEMTTQEGGEEEGGGEEQDDD